MTDQMLVLAAIGDDGITVGVVGMATLIVVVAIVSSVVKGVLRTREIEQTKREVAAYVAEGTMTPQDAQRILSGGNSDFESKIGTAVTWGMISSAKAERLIKAFREEWKKSEG